MLARNRETTAMFPVRTGCQFNARGPGRRTNTLTWTNTWVRAGLRGACISRGGTQSLLTPSTVRANALKSASFLDSVIFGRFNYKKLVSEYGDQEDFYRKPSIQVVDHCKRTGKGYFIKKGTA